MCAAIAFACFTNNVHERNSEVVTYADAVYKDSRMLRVTELNFHLLCYRKTFLRIDSI